MPMAERQQETAARRTGTLRRVVCA